MWTWRGSLTPLTPHGLKVIRHISWSVCERSPWQPFLHTVDALPWETSLPRKIGPCARTDAEGRNLPSADRCLSGINMPLRHRSENDSQHFAASRIHPASLPRKNGDLAVDGGHGRASLPRKIPQQQRGRSRGNGPAIGSPDFADVPSAKSASLVTPLR